MESEGYRQARGVRLIPSGLQVGDRTVPLLAGAVHYWRLDPHDWHAALSAVKSLGLRLVDTYLPWGIHEIVPGEFDWGRRNPRLDVVSFLRAAQEVGLWAIVRPGPQVNAELTWFGLPERVVWDRDCQARSPKGHPVILPAPPLAFPVPSYASRAFRTEAEAWLRAVSRVLGPLCWPHGPVVLLQIDNEGALYFRDGVYDQDYHPDALHAYRRFVQSRYQTVEQLRDAYEDPSLGFEELEPPRAASFATPRDLTAHLDWAEFQEELVPNALAWMRDALLQSGCRDIPTSHNLPPGDAATVLDPARLEAAVDLVGIDYYHRASPKQRSVIARRTTELAARCLAGGRPTFACELGAGFPPFIPPLSSSDCLFTALTALAYGLRGFNLFMAVDRDRWVGAPIDRRGRRRPDSGDWERLVSALDRIGFAELERFVEVAVVIPRSYRRLARVLNAFGAIPPSVFELAGGGAMDGCFDDDWKESGPVTVEVARFLERLESALESRHIPFERVSGDVFARGPGYRRWTILACGGILEGPLREAVQAAWDSAAALTVGPRSVTRDPRMRPVASSLEVPEGIPVPAYVGDNPGQIDDLLDAAQKQLGLGALQAEPAEISVELHRHKTGEPAALFLINPSDHAVDACVSAAGVDGASDALDGQEYHARLGRLELRVPPRSVRMLELR